MPPSPALSVLVLPRIATLAREHADKLKAGGFTEPGHAFRADVEETRRAIHQATRFPLTLAEAQGYIRAVRAWLDYHVSRHEADASFEAWYSNPSAESEAKAIRDEKLVMDAEMWARIAHLPFYPPR